MKILACLFVCTALAGVAFAGLPGWAERFQTSAALGEKIRYDRQLFSQTRIEYAASGKKTEFRTCDAFLVGGDGAVADFSFGIPYSGEDFKSAAAWIIEPNGKIRKIAQENISHHLAWNDALYSDSKVALLFLNNIPTGSIVCLEHTLVIDVMVGCWQIFVQKNSWDLDSSVVELILPSSWSSSLSCQAMDSSCAAITANRVCVGKMKKWEEKPFSGSSGLSAAHIVLKVYPNLDGRPGKSWQDVSTETAQSWAKLKDSIGKLKYISEQPVILESLFKRFEQEFRYVAVEIGNGRMIPHLPKDVIQSKYGDCKDLSFFLRSALTEAGLEAYPVLVHVPWDDSFFPDYPSILQFNHCIIAVVHNADTMYYDPTIGGYDLGTLPPPAWNAYALWVKEDSPLIRLPAGSAEIPITSALSGRLSADGQFSGTLNLCYAHQYRTLAASFPTRQSLENEVRQVLRKDLMMDIARIDTNEGRRELNAEISLKNFARIIGSNLYCNPYPFAAVSDSVENLAAGYFISSVNPLVTKVEIEMPEGAVLPKDTVISHDSDIGSASFSSKANGKILTAQWSRRFLSRHYHRSGKSQLDSLLHAMHSQQSLALKFALHP